MNAVWRVARAAVRRRRLQTIVIGIVVLVSTATMVLALGLLTTASAPFDRAHAQQNGAHLIVTYDNAVVPDDRLAQTAVRPGVEAAAGPFGQTRLQAVDEENGFRGPSLTTVGRADPGGAVDRLTVWQGRWATGSGEIVLNQPPGELGPRQLGSRVESPGHPALTVVGFAFSVSASADAWVSPAQLTELGPTATQMLYRFTSAATADELRADQAVVTAGLPPKATLGSASYLALREAAGSESGVYIPFLVVFGILGLAVSVLIVANVISGAVVAGVRNIGMLKALGFTPNQVMAVYLVMVAVPSAFGCVLGTVAGNLVAGPLLADAFQGFGVTDVGVALWVDALALVGMPMVVVLAALVSALRARRLPAARAISVGAAPRAGRALVVQRWLSGTRLPRSVSLGLGVPLARPARTALTLAAIVLGVVTVTLASGVTLSVTAYRNAVAPSYSDRVGLMAGTSSEPLPPRQSRPRPPKLGDAQDEALLRSTPGAVHVAATSRQEAGVTGGPAATVVFYRGDGADLGPQVLSGHWPDGPGQVAVPSRFLNQRGLAIGDTVTLELGGHRAPVRIVGLVLANNAFQIFAGWATLGQLAPGTRADGYQVQLAPGTDQQAYLNAVTAGDPGLQLAPPRDNSSSQATVLISAATLLTLVLGVVAALGVFNTVVLNARERRRDLGTLKSIGMTPRQVTVMMVTSMGALGVVGGLLGLPLGVVAHQLIAPAMMAASQSDTLAVVTDVYRPPLLVLLALAGIAIAVLGALVPARSAARTTIAEVLHNE